MKEWSVEWRDPFALIVALLDLFFINISVHLYCWAICHVKIVNLYMPDYWFLEKQICGMNGKIMRLINWCTFLVIANLNKECLLCNRSCIYLLAVCHCVRFKGKTCPFYVYFEFHSTSRVIISYLLSGYLQLPYDLIAKTLFKIFSWYLFSIGPIV